MGELSRQIDAEHASKSHQATIKPAQRAYSITLKTTIASKNRLSFRILTHNIRYATKEPFQGERPWTDRKPILLSHLHYHGTFPGPTIICLQEVLHLQLQSIVESLSPNWVHVGVGRDDGGEAGEYSPIFFQPSHWHKLHYETIWLNETRTPCRRGWDAASIRILTCLVLEEQCSTSQLPRRILALNTHFDDQGAIARRESAKLVLTIAAKLRKQWEVDFWFLAGDLNSTVDDGAYQVFNGKDSEFVDARVCLDDRIMRYGDETTFTGFDGQGDDGEGPRRIDFVHLGVEKESNINGEGDSKVKQGRKYLQRYAVLPNRFEDGIYMSDHRAVVVDLEIRSQQGNE